MSLATYVQRMIIEHTAHGEHLRTAAVNTSLINKSNF